MKGWSDMLQEHCDECLLEEEDVHKGNRFKACYFDDIWFDDEST